MSCANTIRGLSLPGMIPTSGGSRGTLLFVGIFYVYVSTWAYSFVTGETASETIAATVFSIIGRSEGVSYGLPG